jgi:hypothetical protein
MFGIEQRETKSQRDPQTDGTTPFVDEQNARSDPEGEQKRRHAVLMECLHDERDRQAEERLQAAIDEDVYDHLHWRREDAAVLMDRGQAPLVYPESRQTIDWISGMQKRMRKDYKILPRERGDEQGAEVKSQVVKYTDDVNLTQWHRSRAGGGHQPRAGRGDHLFRLRGLAQRLPRLARQAVRPEGRPLPVQAQGHRPGLRHGAAAEGEGPPAQHRQHRRSHRR